MEYYLLKQWFSTVGEFTPQGDIFQRTFVKNADILLVTTEGCHWHLVGKLGMLLNSLQCTGQLPTIKNFLAQNITIAILRNSDLTKTLYFYYFKNVNYNTIHNF